MRLFDTGYREPGDFRVVSITQGMEPAGGWGLRTTRKEIYGKDEDCLHPGRIVRGWAGCDLRAISGCESAPQIRGDGCSRRRNKPPSSARAGVARSRLRIANDSRCSGRL